MIGLLLMLKPCFDRLEWKISACWSILAKNHAISLKKMYVYDWITFYFKIVLYIQYCKKNPRRAETIKCSRGAGRYGGGTARRGAAWTFNIFMKTVPGFVSFVSFVLDLVWALRHGNNKKLKIHAAWPRGSIPAAWILNFFSYYIWYSTIIQYCIYTTV